jgi:hypothetical protein
MNLRYLFIDRRTKYLETFGNLHLEGKTFSTFRIPISSELLSLRQSCLCSASPLHGHHCKVLSMLNKATPDARNLVKVAKLNKELKSMKYLSFSFRKERYVSVEIGGFKFCTQQMRAELQVDWVCRAHSWHNRTKLSRLDSIAKWSELLGLVPRWLVFLFKSNTPFDRPLAWVFDGGLVCMRRAVCRDDKGICYACHQQYQGCF